MNRIAVLFLFVVFLPLQAQKKWLRVSLDSAGVERLGVLNDTGKIIVPVQNEVLFQQNGYFITRKQGLWGCYNKQGKNIVPHLYQQIGAGFSEGLIRVKKNGKWGYVDTNHRVVIGFKYDFACNFEQGEAFVTIGNQNMIIDRTGRILRNAGAARDQWLEDTEPVDNINVERNQFTDSIMLISKVNDRYGVIVRRTGRVIVPHEYDQIGKYSRNIILVRQGSYWGAFAHNGKMITAPKYKSIYVFEFE